VVVFYSSEIIDGLMAGELELWEAWYSYVLHCQRIGTLSNYDLHGGKPVK
jgi:hypothetical protein